MNRLRLFPQSHDFFADFTAATANLRETAAVIAALFDGTHSVADGVRTLHELEHRGDEITHTILTALSQSFIPEIDPGDIRDLTERLDDVVDALEEAGPRYDLFRLGQPLPAAQRLARIAETQADVLVQAMALLASGGQAEAVMPLLVELHRLENAADDVLSDALATLYDGVTDVPGVIRARHWGEICQLLEDITDRVERVAHTVEDIVSQRS
jgi:predicted phosphate transport protein (TIGR00153 family)